RGGLVGFARQAVFPADPAAELWRCGNGQAETKNEPPEATMPAPPGARFFLARPAFSSILLRHYDRNHRLPVVPGAAQRLEPHQRLGGGAERPARPAQASSGTG